MYQVEMMSNPYRETSEQYRWADRDFKNGDRVVFVGPPDEEFQPGMMPKPSVHKLYHCSGQIRIGVSEDILVYPDEPDADMYWVRFDDDTQPIRQVKGTWLVKVGDVDKENKPEGPLAS
jgi:hypothetical protein